MAKSKKSRPHKHELYERSVQTPDVHVDWLLEGFKIVTGRKPRSLREDFCGTFLMATEWVQRHKENTAICLDINSEVLDYGKKVHLPKLDEEARSRISIQKKNVMSVTKPAVDLQIAENFSFNVFKEFDDLVKYFKAAYKSIKKNGVFLLEMAGGPGMIEEISEKRKIKDPGQPPFTYIWNQKKFNPINHEGLWTISFKFPDGSEMKDTFVYDWRLWTIPEVRAALKIAGFEKTHVFWEEADEDGEGNGVYYLTEDGENDHTWISYVVGHKK